MEYENFMYYYPPRPDDAIPAASLSLLEQEGWHAQIKKNGTCNIFDVTPERSLICWNRHKQHHKAWRHDERTTKAFQNLPGKGYYKFVAELLHSKIPGIRHTNYINDILVSDGESLVGTTFTERQILLSKLFPNRSAPVNAKLGIGYSVIDEYTLLAATFTPGEGYLALFRGLVAAVDEGIVLKRPDARLSICSREGSNASWQRKVRKPTKVLAF